MGTHQSANFVWSRDRGSEPPSKKIDASYPMLADSCTGKRESYEKKSGYYCTHKSIITVNRGIGKEGKGARGGGGPDNTGKGQGAKCSKDTSLRMDHLSHDRVLWSVTNLREGRSRKRIDAKKEGNPFESMAF